jgi:hypothetical protein
MRYGAALERTVGASRFAETAVDVNENARRSSRR